jgi:rubrerythrin
MPVEVDQVRTIGIMAAHESAIGDLYRAYARRFPERSEFFEGLAEDEVRHARLIAGFADDVKAGKVEINAGRFPWGSVLASIDAVRSLVAEANREKMTLVDALATARDLEHELIEKCYFEIAEGDAPELKVLLESLAEETELHRRTVEEEWAKERGGRPGDP